MSFMEQCKCREGRIVMNTETPTDASQTSTFKGVPNGSQKVSIIHPLGFHWHPFEGPGRRRIFDGVFLKKGMGHPSGISRWDPSLRWEWARQPKFHGNKKKPSKYPRCFAGAGGWMRENVGYPKLYSGYKEKEVNLILKFLEIGLWNGLIFSVYIYV